MKEQELAYKLSEIISQEVMNYKRPFIVTLREIKGCVRLLQKHVKAHKGLKGKEFKDLRNLVNLINKHVDFITEE